MVVVPNPALVKDLLGRGYHGSDEVAQVRLDEAWRALTAEVRSVPAALHAGTLEALVVIDVLCAAAMRVLRNAEQYADGAASQDLYFTSAEKARVSPAAPADTSTAAFTIRPR
ncbi:hypothetical protein [Nocardioides marmoraquaticus]